MQARSLSRVFIEDARIFLSTIREFTRNLRQGKTTEESRNNAFRSAHSLKSEAAFLGYDQLAGKAAKVESLLAGLRGHSRDSKTSGNRNLVIALAELEKAFEAVAETPEKPTYRRRAADRRRTSLELGSFERQLVREAHSRGEGIFRLSCRIEEEAEMEQARRFLLISNLEQKTNLIGFAPSLDSEPQPDGRFEGLLSTAAGEGAVRESTAIAGVRDVEIHPIAVDSFLEDTPESDLVAQLATGQPSLSVSIPSRRYEELLMFSSELSRLAASAGEGQNMPLIRKVAAIVEDYLLQSSETPAKMLFDILRPRMKSFAEGLNRSVRLETEGESTAVFVTTAYALVDSLIQLVHNAVLHGIEEPDERSRRGKAPMGCVTVVCKREEERLVFEVKDDGRGMTTENLQATYQELFQRQPPESLLSIVAEPGFSTRRRDPREDRHAFPPPMEDDSAGGGIGLDGVRYTVERLFGGELSLASTPGKGAAFRLSIPAGRKLLSVVVARSGETQFAVPAALVIDALPIQSRLVSRDREGNRYIRYDGRNIRLYRIYEGQSLEGAGAGRQFAILVRLGKKRSAILVDELISNELALLDESYRSHVFSQRAEKYVPFLVPLQLL